MAVVLPVATTAKESIPVPNVLSNAIVKINLRVPNAVFMMMKMIAKTIVDRNAAPRAAARSRLAESSIKTVARVQSAVLTVRTNVPVAAM